jgi:hypothetical protein
MAYNFLRGDRDQPFLLPPDLRDWLQSARGTISDMAARPFRNGLFSARWCGPERTSRPFASGRLGPVRR